MFQLSTLREEFNDRKRDLTDVSDRLFLRFMNNIANFIYPALYGIDPERYIDGGTTYVVTSNNQSSALPEDFRSMELGGLYLMKSNGTDTKNKLPMSGFGSSAHGFYLSGDNIVFTGCSSESYRLRYIPERTLFTDLSDYFSLDATLTGTRFIRDAEIGFLLEALDEAYSAWDEDSMNESLAGQRMIRMLEPLLANKRRGSSVLSLTDFSDNNF